MGWRGALRSLGAASRRIGREQHRQHRELLKRQERNHKLQAAQQAALEVASYEKYLDLVTTVHRDCSEVWDWSSVLKAPAPVPPVRSNQLEAAQRVREQQHSPGFFDKVFGRLEAKAAASDRSIEEARAADQTRYAAALKEHETSMGEWKTLQRIAGGVLAGDAAALKEALEELNPFEDIKELGRKVNLSFSPRYAEAAVFLHGIEHVPREIKSLLKTGKVSTKLAPESFINQTYQAHVCSCVLRVARELFAVLPFPKVFVHGLALLLNPQTGNMEPKPIISVLMPRETFGALNFERLDPADCMRNFVHQMAFSKAKGFSPVSLLNPRDF